LWIAAGCNFFAAAGMDNPFEPGEDTAGGDEMVLPTSTATPFQLAPTIDPDEEDRAPTPLPEPTTISSENGEEDGEAGGEESEPEDIEFDRSGIGLIMEPNLGEPGDIVEVIGFGFEPGEEVVLYWSPLDGERGEEDARIDADSGGEFERLVMIPPAEEWPGGPPNELDYIQMRAYSPSLREGEYYFVNFRYIKRFLSEGGIVLEFENPDYPYRVGAPNAWSWTWEVTDDEGNTIPARNVRFEGPNGEEGFIRVFENTNVSSIIKTVMSEEFGGSYTTEDSSLGAYPGTQAVTDDGELVLFLTNGGRTYAVSFSLANGEPYDSIISTFRFTD